MMILVELSGSASTSAGGGGWMPIGGFGRVWVSRVWTRRIVGWPSPRRFTAHNWTLYHVSASEKTTKRYEYVYVHMYVLGFGCEEIFGID